MKRAINFAGKLTVLALITHAPATFAADFGFEQVIAKAKTLAGQPYKAPKAVPKFLQDLDYSTYQQIRFKPDQALWRAADSRFQVMLVSPGLYYKHAVKINIIDAKGVHPLGYDKDDFDFPSRKFAQQVPDDLGYAGFKLTYPLRGPHIANQFLVFAGASYFRGVGRNNAFGLSARGITIDTGLPSGEQFPAFTEYWLVRPSAKARAMKFYALLDGKSLTGAYQFVVYPGSPTRLMVKAVLFPRHAIKQIGVAPLTSMFFYGSNTARPSGEWRPQVHDSDGLLIHNGNGEWLWRPLIDPRNLKLDYFAANNVHGFGLMQRETHFRNYQDAGANYQARPSAWVKPDKGWGKGHVVLVEIPTPNETNDNIVAFWTPEKPVEAGQRLAFGYSLALGAPDIAGESMAHAQQTFVGRGDVIGGGDVRGAYRIIVDFQGGPLDKLSPNVPVTGVVTGENGTQVIGHFVEYVPDLKQWRLSILAKPEAGKAMDLRAFLKRGDKTLSETWSYGLPPQNSIDGAS